MKRIKLLVPAAGAGDPTAMLGRIRVVDADTGEAIEPVQDVKVHFPFDDKGPGVVRATLEVLVAEIETVPADEWKRLDPAEGWEKSIMVR